MATDRDWRSDCEVLRALPEQAPGEGGVQKQNPEKMRVRVLLFLAPGIQSEQI